MMPLGIGCSLAFLGQSVIPCLSPLEFVLIQSGDHSVQLWWQGIIPIECCTLFFLLPAYECRLCITVCIPCTYWSILHPSTIAVVISKPPRSLSMQHDGPFAGLFAGIKDDAPKATPVTRARDVHLGRDDAIKDVEERSDLALKMSAMALQQSRQAMANSTRSAPLRVNGNVYTVMQDAKKQYDSKTRGKKDHGKGTPDQWVGCAVLVLLHNRLHGAKTNAGVASAQNSWNEDKEKLLNKLSKFLQACGQLPSKFAQRNIKQFKIEKMHESTVRRLIINLRDHEFEDMVLDHIEEFDEVNEWYGTRPAGFLETRAQTYLDKADRSGTRVTMKGDGEG